MALLVVRCGCGRPWSPPVRLSVAVLRCLLSTGIDAGVVVATTRCRHCGQVTRHTLADALRTAS